MSHCFICHGDYNDVHYCSGTATSCSKRCETDLEKRISRLERIVKKGFDSKTPMISEEVEDL
jgi:hypothetical protein